MIDRYPWPDELDGALCVSFDFDGESPYLWRTRRDESDEIAELEQRRYGPRRGIYNILTMLAEVSVPATFFIPGWIAAHYREAVVEIAAAGHELALHGWCHEPPGALSDQEMRETLTRASGLLGDIAGAAPIGYRSPSFQMTLRGLEVLASVGLRYDSSMMGSDRPYLIGDLVEVPVDWTTDDAIFYRYTAGDVRPPVPAATVIESWAAEIKAAARLGTLVTLTMHPWMSGRPARVTELGRLLQEVRNSGHLWLGHISDLAEYHRSVPKASFTTIADSLGRPHD